MRAALHPLLLAVLLVTAGCAGLLGPDRPPSDERAVEAVERSTTAIEDVDSYQFTLDGTFEASKGDEHVDADVSGSGAVDVAGREMFATAEARDEERGTYVANGTTYSECARIGWGRQNLSTDTPWIHHTPAGHHIALLNATDVYWRGTETIDGAETVVVEAYPTKQEVLSVAESKGTDVTDIRDANLRNFTLTVWLDAASHLPVQARTVVKLKTDGATAETRLTTEYSDYGAPVNVTRPPLDREVLREFGC